jgi:hypothetical protein
MRTFEKSILEALDMVLGNVLDFCFAYEGYAARG